MEEMAPYGVAYIASPEEPTSTDPDVIAYNECKIAIHMAEEMLAKMRLHLSLIEQRINNKKHGKTITICQGPCAVCQ